MSESVRVRGDATAEEVVAVLAALSSREPADEPSRYELWRRRRLSAISDTARPS